MYASGDEIQRIVETYRGAARANCGTPARVGNVVQLGPQEAADVMITADLHGHQDNFEAILRTAELDAHPRRHLILQEVCHGGPTYPGGGCRSHTLLEAVANLKVRYAERVHFLLSNHELAELTDFPILKGQAMLNLAFRCGLREAYGAASETVRRAQLEFLRSCPLAVRMPGDVFVSHSLPAKMDECEFDASIFERPLDASDFEGQGSLFHLLWGRDYRVENARAFAQLVGARVLINGHDPCPAGYKTPNDVQVILDCSSKPATYVILPTGEPLDHPQVVERIGWLS